MAIHDAPEPVGWPSLPPFRLIAPSLRNVCGGRCAAEFGQQPSLISRRRGTDKLAGVLGRLEQRRCRLEQPRDPRSMGLFRRLVREALSKIAVENGGPNLKQKMSAPL